MGRLLEKLIAKRLTNRVKKGLGKMDKKQIAGFIIRNVVREIIQNSEIELKKDSLMISFKKTANAKSQTFPSFRAIELV